MRKGLLVAFGFLILCSTLHMGCSSGAVNENSPDELYKDADRDLTADRFALALDKFRKVKNKFPYSSFSALAQLKIADTYFKQEAFGDAATAYETFRDLHPKHEKVQYAVFQIGESYYKDIPSPIARDMSSAKKALEGFQDFLNRYPQDPQATDAKKRILDIRTLIAKKELYIANFYYRRDYYKAAEQRYRNIVQKYADTSVAKEAEDKLKKTEKKIKEGASL